MKSEEYEDMDEMDDIEDMEDMEEPGKMEEREKITLDEYEKMLLKKAEEELLRTVTIPKSSGSIPTPSAKTEEDTKPVAKPHMTLSELGELASKIAAEKKAASDSAFQLRKELVPVLISDADLDSRTHPMPTNLQRIMNENGIYKVVVDLSVNIRNEIERYTAAALKMSGAPYDMDATFKGAVLVMSLSVCRGDQGDMVLEYTNDEDERLVVKKQKLALVMRKETDSTRVILNPDLII